MSVEVKLAVVITTIQGPTPAVHAHWERVGPLGAALIVAGDKVGPFEYDMDDVQFLSLEAQKQMPHALAQRLPERHYARKNLGYLAAMDRGAKCIYETDDDNAPGERWQMRTQKIEARPIRQRGWCNAYRCFSGARIWPRGYPLDEIAGSLEQEIRTEPAAACRAPIQQGLVNGCPDVDAIWHLVSGGGDFEFDEAPSIFLDAGVWCPFNSQSTWWWPSAYPLLYLPSYCSFRMTDIWRSFVAQRCLWEMGDGVAFHAPEVVQVRNPHDLMRDFRDEIPGYTSNRQIADLLEHLSLKAGREAVSENFLRCYEALAAAGIFPASEVELARCWVADVAASETDIDG